ncbi:Cytochrome b561 [Macleaya cordata]|uniref:Cytochrome b561 n=1 Tax=Macleaya cordata TaxID=56857 RepID=A0A200Q0Q1_MACCD|nr:Cytochrome b561 [Macleaya cordata]
MGRTITHCKKLGTLGAEFGWNYHNDHIHNRTTIGIFFSAQPLVATGWVAWGVNPRRRPHMVGTRALIGFQHPNGSSFIDTYNITRDTKNGCQFQPSEIEVRVGDKRVMYSAESGFLTISATLTLPPEYNISKLNHVWQVGSWVQDFEPQMHDDTLQNFDSAETIDLTSGKSRSVRHDLRYLRTAHGILNIVGWGTLIPAGAIIARYFKEFPVKFEGWYYIHISCQILGYLIGATGWVIGIWLGNTSRYYDFTTHRDFGIIIFTFTTLQVLALFFRPTKVDEYRGYWNIYHHLLGYTLIILIAVNIFKGINILRPDKIWKRTYVGVLGTLALTALILEVFTWTKFMQNCKRLSRRSSVS